MIFSIKTKHSIPDSVSPLKQCTHTRSDGETHTEAGTHMHNAFTYLYICIRHWHMFFLSLTREWATAVDSLPNGIDPTPRLIAVICIVFSRTEKAHTHIQSTIVNTVISFTRESQATFKHTTTAVAAAVGFSHGLWVRAWEKHCVKRGRE